MSPIANEPRRVIIESPFAGDVERNIKYARACLRDSLMRDEAPLCSHLLYTQEGVLDDNNPEERARGILAGCAWYRSGGPSYPSPVKACVVYTDLGISSGMKAGIAAASQAGVPIEFRSILQEEAHNES